MRKIILTLVGFVLSVGVYSQISLVTYEPVVIVPNRSSGSSNTESVGQAPSYSVQPDVYVRGVLNNSGYSATWHSCNNGATKVNAQFDGNSLANNFEWKASGGRFMGTVYFNY